MYCIVYMSAGVDITPAVIHTIWEQANHNNVAKGITGILLHGKSVFMQYIEGDERDVTALFQKISSDSRHTGIVSLYKGPINERHFPDWRMGCKELSGSDISDLETELQWSWAADRLFEVRDMSAPASLLTRMITIFFDPKGGGRKERIKRTADALKNFKI